MQDCLTDVQQHAGDVVLFFQKLSGWRLARVTLHSWVWHLASVDCSFLGRAGAGTEPTGAIACRRVPPHPRTTVKQRITAIPGVLTWGGGKLRRSCRLHNPHRLLTARPAGPQVQQSETDADDELLSLAVVKGGAKVVVGSQSGMLDIWSWGHWAGFSDRFPGELPKRMWLSHQENTRHVLYMPMPSCVLVSSHLLGEAACHRRTAEHRLVMDCTKRHPVQGSLLRGKNVLWSAENILLRRAPFVGGQSGRPGPGHCHHRQRRWTHPGAEHTAAQATGLRGAARK